MNLNEIQKQNLSRIKLSKEEGEEILDYVKKFILKLNFKLKKFKAKVFMGGSFSKNTVIRKKNYDVDLHVIGTHGRTGLQHMLIGSVAEKVVRKAPCQVLTVKHPDYEFEMP